MDKKNILIINGHPMKKTFNDALAKAYKTGAKKGKHAVKEIKLSKDKFDPTLRTFDKSKESSASAIRKYQKEISKADHLVVIYPTWWLTMPALLKGFFDKVFSSGFAYRFEKKPIPKKLLKGKSARIITTMDAPPFFYRLMYRSAGVYLLKKGILQFCGIKPVKTTLIGSVKFSDDKKRKQWLDKVSSLGIRAK
ncbi:MAG: NAD(P)H-dependent oxidoreductase [Nanobdellota archaeon]